MFDNCRNSKKQGDVGLGQAIAYFARTGWTVCIPMTDSQEYDLVVDDGGGLKRVQVKTTRYVHKQSGRYSVNLRTMGGNQSYHTSKNFDKTRVDLVYIVLESGDEFLIPAKDIQSVTTFCVTSSHDKYRVSGRCPAQESVKLPP